MRKIKVGDKVRVKDRLDWPSPPGYRWAEAEGIVTKLWEESDPVAYCEYVEVRLNKAITSIELNRFYNFRQEHLEIIS